MEKKFFRIIGLVMTIVMLFALAGCGVDGVDSDVNASPQNGGSADVGEFSDSGYSLNTTRNPDGSYTYHDICGQDWTISFRVEDLVKDGVIDHWDLNEAMGLGEGALYDEQGYCYAITFSFIGLNSFGFSDIDVMGKVLEDENLGVAVWTVCWEGLATNQVRVLSGDEYYPVALEQLVVAIYGCQYYMDRSHTGDPYGGKLSDDYKHETNTYFVKYRLH